MSDETITEIAGTIEAMSAEEKKKLLESKHTQEEVTEVLKRYEDIKEGKAPKPELALAPPTTLAGVQEGSIAERRLGHTNSLFM